MGYNLGMKRLVIFIVLTMHSVAFSSNWQDFIIPETTPKTPLLYTPIDAFSEPIYEVERYEDAYDSYDNYDYSYDQEYSDFGYNYPKIEKKYIYPDLVITVCEYNADQQLYCYDL